MICRIALVVFLWFSGLVYALEPDKLYEKLSPSVWVVLAYDGAGVRVGSASAVVTGPEELITNCHVLRKVKSISVKRDNTLHSARLEHADVERDLCTLRVRGINAPGVAIAPLASVRVGQRVYAIGAPLGYELTLSDGLVSSLNRNENQEIQAIQISVPISPGSSGGGLFDQDGRLIGITSMTQRNAQNLNFARPAEWIYEVPVRARVALDKFSAENEARKVVAEQLPNKGIANVDQGRQVTGDELRSHFVSLGTVNAHSSSIDRLTINFRANGFHNMSGASSGSGVGGSYTIKDSENQVCLSVHSASGYQVAYTALGDCYRLFEQAAGEFMLISLDGKTFIKYKRM